MDLIILVLTLAFIGFLVWLITEKVPMDPMFKLAIQIIVVFAVILWLIQRFSGNVPNIL